MIVWLATESPTSTGYGSGLGILVIGAILVWAGSRGGGDDE